MGKYRGSDGWLHDDSIGSRRYHHRDSVSGPPSREHPDKCPNCGFAVSWRRMEGICDRCDWGKPPTKPMSEAELAGCCGMVGVVIALPLLGTGMGYAFGGFGGLLAGLGIAVATIFAATAGLVLLSRTGDSKAENDG